MWDDDDVDVDHWPPAVSSFEAPQALDETQVPVEEQADLCVGCIPEETGADPTDSPKPQVHNKYECRTVRSGGPLEANECRTVRSGGPTCAEVDERAACKRRCRV